MSQKWWDVNSRMFSPWSEADKPDYDFEIAHVTRVFTSWECTSGPLLVHRGLLATGAGDTSASGGSGRRSRHPSGAPVALPQPAPGK